MQHNTWADAQSKWLNLYTFPITEGEYSKGNGLMSITARWRLEESDADFYLEWAREDYWANFDDLITEPDHSQAYVLGFEKLVGPETAPFRLSWELVHLGSASDNITRGLKERVNGFYAHEPMTQ